MIIAKEMSLKEFTFWAGAKETAELLTDEEFDIIEDMLESDERQWSETQVNDLFWFDTDFIAEILGYEDYEQMWGERHHD